MSSRQLRGKYGGLLGEKIGLPASIEDIENTNANHKGMPTRGG
jgi:hypothetical protein